MQLQTPHSFHIPVMGLAYTIDTPIKVARFGISSVISIIEDNLIEKMRCHYYEATGSTYQPITSKATDYRAKRITDYLNLVHRIVQEQMATLKSSSFEPGSDLNQYFEMLPDESDLKRIFGLMTDLSDPEDIQQLEDWLKGQIQPGSIDVNIMTKLDKTNMDAHGNVIEDGSDAVAALRGYANSTLSNSSVILSAGMNPRLFSYMEKHNAFDASSCGHFEKKIVVKVSDYRSALIQGKMLAKKGLWVSEFRIESGLNCGGHAFATDGYLLGPILEEFKNKKEELCTTLFEIYNQALVAKGKVGFTSAHPIKITVQGGIGTHAEHELLRKYFHVDSTGWGTPFLLVPQATTVDEATLQLLSKATEKDVILSKNSPLGVRFHYLKGTTGEKEKLNRIAKGKPGSPCTEKYLVSNTEFTKEPICTASRVYQKRKIAQLQEQDLPENEYKDQMQEVLDKECLCIGLSNAAIQVHQAPPFKKLEAVNICPGPNIAYFSKIVSLKEMIDHIYGRINIIQHDDRPHMFMKELSLYVTYWTELLNEGKAIANKKKQDYIKTFYDNLINGISYYRDLTARLNEEFASIGSKLTHQLEQVESQLGELFKNHLASSPK
ncbi:MAG TPA: hypothetical protein DIS90_03320 [Cytophagales bacterium]|nr:hypothetical protein [Cytophagales bacterium]